MGNVVSCNRERNLKPALEIRIAKKEGNECEGRGVAQVGPSIDLEGK